MKHYTARSRPCPEGHETTPIMKAPRSGNQCPVAGTRGICDWTSDEKCSSTDHFRPISNVVKARPRRSRRMGSSGPRASETDQQVGKRHPSSCTPCRPVSVHELIILPQGLRVMAASSPTKKPEEPKCKDCSCASRYLSIDRSLQPFDDRDLKGLTLMGETELRHGPRANDAEVTIGPLGDRG